MSIILDALKKSETERQQQGSSEFSQVPIRPPGRKTPVWIWLLVGLLAINLVILTSMLLRPGSESAKPVETMPVATLNAPPQSKPVQEQVPEPAAAVANTATPAQSTADATSEPGQPLPVVEQQIVESPPARTGGRVTVEPVTIERSAQALPDIDQLRVSGELNVPAQRLDIHVFSEEPANRFVFINMSKLREGATSDDGLTVEEITPNGVILRSGGRRFFLARQ